MLFHCCSSCPHCPGYHHLARARPAEWGETPETQDTHESQSSCSQIRNPLGARSSVSSWHPVMEVGYVQPRSTSPCSLAHRFKESDKQPLVFSHLPLGDQACAQSHAGELSRVGGRGWSNLHLLTRLSSGTAPRGDRSPAPSEAPTSPTAPAWHASSLPTMLSAHPGIPPSLSSIRAASLQEHPPQPLAGLLPGRGSSPPCYQ